MGDVRVRRQGPSQANFTNTSRRPACRWMDRQNTHTHTHTHNTHTHTHTHTHTRQAPPLPKTHPRISHKHRVGTIAYRRLCACCGHGSRPPVASATQFRRPRAHPPPPPPPLDPCRRLLSCRCRRWPPSRAASDASYSSNSSSSSSSSSSMLQGWAKARQHTAGGCFV